MSRLQDLALELDPVVGGLYRFDGVYFAEFEDGGLVPGEFLGEDLFEVQKEEAYCFFIEPGCSELLKPESAWDQDIVAELEAEVEFLEREQLLRPEFGSNQCFRGFLRLKRIGKIDFLVPKKV